MQIMQPENTIENCAVCTNENTVDVCVSSWNIAAINNNPFEFWISYSDSTYDDMMQAVETFISDQQNDLTIQELFSNDMFLELKYEFEELDVHGLPALEEIWKLDFSQRFCFKEFLQDTAIGDKRLASMPDRITNTINLIDGSKLMRPTVINAYDSGLPTQMEWWKKWIIFMFHTEIQIYCEDSSAPPPSQSVFSLIGPIYRSKYPALTAEEQEISVPLQILCLAILDAIFLHIMNSVAPSTWETIRRDISHALIRGKEQGVCRIIAEAYPDADVFFIQEAAAMLIHTVRADARLDAAFAALSPGALDAKRNQNSLILVARRRFAEETFRDVTRDVLALLGGMFVLPGDLFAASVRDRNGAPWLLASFHGDSNGLSSQPAIAALCAAARSPRFAGHVLLVGADANTQTRARDRFHQGVAAFREFLAAQGLASLWDAHSDPARLTTTGSARTCLQTQIHKAVPFAARGAARANLKDWILGDGAQVGAGAG